MNNTNINGRALITYTNITEVTLSDTNIIPSNAYTTLTNTKAMTNITTVLTIFWIVLSIKSTPICKVHYPQSPPYGIL